MSGTIVHETDTEYNHYQVVDMVYDGRQARVLFSGRQQAAQSGIAMDGEPDLLFDYNQRFMELLEQLKPKRVLLIGGGALTLPKAALAAFPEMHITVVEPDAQLADIAYAFFDVPKDSGRLTVVAEEGRAFAGYCIQTYDAILIDAFSHTVTPRSLFTREAVQAYRRLLNSNGFVAVNIISAFYGRHAEILQQQTAAYKEAFPDLQLFPASRSLLSFHLPQNFVLVAQNESRPVELRFRQMDIAEIETVPSLRDVDVKA